MYVRHHKKIKCEVERKQFDAYANKYKNKRSIFKLQKLKRGICSIGFKNLINKQIIKNNRKYKIGSIKSIFAKIKYSRIL